MNDRDIDAVLRDCYSPLLACADAVKCVHDALRPLSERERVLVFGLLSNLFRDLHDNLDAREDDKDRRKRACEAEDAATDAELDAVDAAHAQSHAGESECGW